ncbi:MFS transporter [Streptomyces sp. NPDC057062]|uniref:MFS transporter n=1 Tax=Streptomyces sp. NPDC057062 TaxID=3346011 RepID=UPI00364535D5
MPAFIELPNNTKLLLGSMFVSAVGGGLVQPFLIVYLKNYRHIPVAVATVALSLIAASSIAGALASGHLIDRVSLRRAGIVYLTIVSVGTTAFAVAVAPSSALLAAAVYGFGLGGGGTVLNAAVARTTEPESNTTAVFGAKVAAINAGIGIGVLVGALLVNSFGQSVFPAMYLADGISSLTVVMAFARVVTAGEADRPQKSGAAEQERAQAMPRTVPGSSLMAVLVVAGVLFAVGYGQIQSSLPVISTSAHVSSSALAVTFFLNSVAIVVCQAALSSWMTSAAPNSVLVRGACAWAAVWAIFFPLVMSDSVVLNTALLAIAMTTFAIGEVLVGGALPAMVNAMADDTNRGRYNARLSLAMQTGQVAGPLAAGGLLAGGHAGFLIGLLIVSCALSAAAASRIQRNGTFRIGRSDSLVLDKVH